jgi:Helix-turn-helix
VLRWASDAHEATLVQPGSSSRGRRYFRAQVGHCLKPPNTTALSRPLALPLAFQYFARQSKPLSVLPVMYLGARESLRLSLRQTAKKSGLTLARVFAIENGEARLNLPQLASLADAFGFSSRGEFLVRWEQTHLPHKEARKKRRQKQNAPRHMVLSCMANIRRVG